MAANLKPGRSDHPASDVKASFRVLTREIESLHNDLLAFQAKTMQRFDKMDRGFGRKFRKIDDHLGGIERELRGLRADMPKIVRKALRDAIEEVRSKP
jgi:hypothetical protein